MLSFIEFLIEVKDSAILRRFADKQGVNLTMRTDPIKGITSTSGPGHRPNDWYIGGLYRRGAPLGDDPDPNKRVPAGAPGAGTKVMRAINKLADKRKKHVSLIPANKEVADKIYSKVGYSEDPKSPKEHEPDKFMRREE